MDIEILGTESVGVRGLSCVVKTSDRNIVFDPGLALGYHRRGFLPHPIQVAAGECVREKIIRALHGATDVVVSHFHGDHMPLTDANPYQLRADRVAHLLRSVRLWTKGTDNESTRIRRRIDSFCGIVRRNLPNAEGQKSGPLTFSMPMPHGERDNGLGTVLMTRVASSSGVFVHASDIQLMDDEPIQQILSWEPNVVLLSGPSIYRGLSRLQQKQVWRRATALARQVDTCIIDHHLLRCDEGMLWLERLSAELGDKVMCAADFMKQPRRLLEAHRVELYRKVPVAAGWHEAYSHGRANTMGFRDG